MRAILLSVFGLCTFGAAHAADLDDPVWDKAPAQEDWAKAYPAHAAQAGISGAVKLKCAATSAGLLSSCAVIQETPIGEGFGAAALSLASGMALKPSDGAGQPVSGRNLIVPVKFEAAMLQHPGTIVGHPDWLRKPDVEAMMRYFPANAGGKGGKTAIECVVSNRGLLEDCAVQKEEPAGHGFGAAAVAMSATFLMRPMTLDGLPVGGAKVIIPINFEGAPGERGGEERFPQSTERVIRTAPWMTAPTAQQVAEAFPKAAVGKTSSAHVVLRCALRIDGHLSECDTISETPGGRGFAGAAKELTKDFRAYVDPTKDKVANLFVDIPFDFRDPSAPVPPIEIYDPMWLKRVNPDYVVKLFPAAASAAGVKNGLARVQCAVQHDGGLKECSVLSEEPAGMGFGDSGLVVAGVMAMNPWTAQGTPVDGAKIVLPIRFVAAESPAPATPAPAKP